MKDGPTSNISTGAEFHTQREEQPVLDFMEDPLTNTMSSYLDYPDLVLF